MPRDRGLRGPSGAKIPAHHQDSLGLLSLPSRLLVLEQTGQTCPGWWTSSEGALHRRSRRSLRDWRTSQLRTNPTDAAAA